MIWFVLLLNGFQLHAAELNITGLRSGKGAVAVSIFSEAGRESYPGESGGAAQTYYLELEGKTEIGFELKDLAPGRYAIAVLHDEDGDRKFDSMAGIPAEGFGFSNNPTVYFGAPGFDRTAVQVGEADKVPIKMKYIF